MSFGDKRLDAAYDRWVTQTPEEYFGENSERDEFEEWLDAAIQYYKNGATFSKIKKLIGGSKEDFKALKEYILSERIRRKKK